MAATKTELVTRTYKASHGREPSKTASGLWTFRRWPTNEVVSLNGTLAECKRQLPEGRWIVLP